MRPIPNFRADRTGTLGHSVHYDREGSIAEVVTVFIRRKRSLLSKVVPVLAVAGLAQSFIKGRGRRAGKLSKLIGTASIAALAMQKGMMSRTHRRW